VHLAEEYWCGGYLAHLSNTRGVNLSRRRFLLLAGLGLVLMVVGLILAQWFRFPQLLLVIFGTVVLANGLLHTISGLMAGKYTPGFLLGLLL
jgi:hypothetical protein